MAKLARDRPHAASPPIFLELSEALPGLQQLAIDGSVQIDVDPLPPRTQLRMVEKRREPPHASVGETVLQPTSLLVSLLPVYPELLREEDLEQAVLVEDRPR